ncbi:MAG: S26 family signal peptidase [Planctomycetota bacterium]
MSTLRALRDAALIALVAVLTVQGLRRWVGDRYLVPSDSMEPVIHGDPVHGDVVFVDKTARVGGRRRGDLVVVAHPEQPGHQLVKRVVADGDDVAACCIDIQNGELWLGPDQQNLRPVVKDPLASGELRVAWSRWRGADGGDPFSARLTLGAERAFESVAAMRETLREDVLLARQKRVAFASQPQNPLPDGVLGTLQPIDATYLDLTGRRSETGAGEMVRDASLTLELEPSSAAELLLTVETPGEALTWHWQSSGALGLWRNGVDVENVRLAAGPVSRVTFGLLDNRVWIDLGDGRTAVIARHDDWVVTDERGLPPGFRTLLHAAAVGEPLRPTAVAVDRDIYYARLRVAALPGSPGSWPRTVPQGQWFLLGDNCFDSRDSRQFGAVAKTSFLGVPCCVIGPPARRRWLCR